MKIPSCFYGTYKKVKAEIRKLYTQIKRGKALEDIFAPFELLDINDYPIEFIPKYNGEYLCPNNLIWVDGGSGASVGGIDYFILSPFASLFFEDDRFDTGKELEELKLKLIPFLAKTEWGCIILNSSQDHWWVYSPKCKSGYTRIPVPADEIPSLPPNYKIIENGIPMKFVPPEGYPYGTYPVDPDYALLILESTAKYWDNFVSYGRRFFAGGYGDFTFRETLPLYRFILSRLGIEGEETFNKEEADRIITSTTRKDRYFKWGNIKDLCEKHSLFEKLRGDEDFRNKALNGVLVPPQPAQKIISKIV
jgi:hypothetical protein